MSPDRIFSLRTPSQFEKTALEVFRHQAKNNPVYNKYIGTLRIDPAAIRNSSRIPFLPIEFFKTHEVVTAGSQESGVRRNTNSSSHRTPHTALFLSSGTTSENKSRHYVGDISLYEKSFRKCFELFYGDIKKYAVLALLPSYYENRESSLLYMVKDLIGRSGNKHSSFYNHKDENLLQALKELQKKKQKTILFGVSFALFDLTPYSSPRSGEGRSSLIVIETGGMKGRREEITREELHKTLCEKFGVKKVHSEYGMTELLSQAWSKGDGIFKCPPWMKVLVRDANDPFSFLTHGKTGALNIIDLANIHSCSFIATQDAGRTHRNGTFEVLGRLDNTDLRGCNLMAG